MKILDTKIAGVYVVETNVFLDERGQFYRTFCARELAPVLNGESIMQSNFSGTVKKGSVRGMHFQKPPYDELKMVRCLRGRIWDVALDLRRDSPTFLKWHAEELTPDNRRMLVIPRGCAHGFQTLENDCEMIYLHTGFYEPSSEGGVRYSDPLAAIKWPLAVTTVSERDASYDMLDSNFKGF